MFIHSLHPGTYLYTFYTQVELDTQFALRYKLLHSLHFRGTSYYTVYTQVQANTQFTLWYMFIHILPPGTS